MASFEENIISSLVESQDDLMIMVRHQGYLGSTFGLVSCIFFVVVLRKLTKLTHHVKENYYGNRTFLVKTLARSFGFETYVDPSSKELVTSGYPLMFQESIAHMISQMLEQQRKKIEDSLKDVKTSNYSKEVVAFASKRCDEIMKNLDLVETHTKKVLFDICEELKGSFSTNVSLTKEWIIEAIANQNESKPSVCELTVAKELSKLFERAKEACSQIMMENYESTRDEIVEKIKSGVISACPLLIPGFRQEELANELKGLIISLTNKLATADGSTLLSEMQQDITREMIETYHHLRLEIKEFLKLEMETSNAKILMELKMMRGEDYKKELEVYTMLSDQNANKIPGNFYRL